MKLQNIYGDKLFKEKEEISELMTKYNVYEQEIFWFNYQKLDCYKRSITNILRQVHNR